MYGKLLTTLCTAITLCIGCSSPPQQDNPLIETPPMGWNSWICFGTSVTEAEVKANADFMAEKMKPYGWEYIVIDAGWYAPGMVVLEDYLNPAPNQLIDEWGRLIVDVQKHPSAAGGGGFKALADYVHSKGLKIGLHIMRGIPIQAVEQNTPIKGTPYRAKDIVLESSRCDWYYGFIGIDMTKPGAQAYYDSIFELYAEWGIDYVKADDLLSPVYAYNEIEAICTASRNCGREIVMSLSPGPAPVENTAHLRQMASLWRVSEDFWDDWDSLLKQFDLCRKWAPYVETGHYPDPDMLPIGPMAQRAMRGEPRMSNFTRDEQYTMVSLWAMFRAPLMLGCNLPEMDDFTLSLITNQEVIDIDQRSENNREWFAEEGARAWYASASDGNTDYVAVFNLGEEPLTGYVVDFTPLGAYAVARELWTKAEIAISGNKSVLTIAPHGVALLKLTKQQPE